MEQEKCGGEIHIKVGGDHGSGSFKMSYELQEKELEDIKSKAESLLNAGPCVKGLDEVLNTLNVKRQAYHGKSFVRNHVNKMLKVTLFFPLVITLI